MKPRRLVASVAGVVLGVALGAVSVVEATPAIAGPIPPSFDAVVDYSGNLVRGHGVSGVTHIGPGQFEVAFTQDVSACSYVATVADPGNALVYYPGLVFTATGHMGGNDVYVETKNLGGGLSDYPYHLQVNCPNSPGEWAVIDPVLGLVRGSGVTLVDRMTRGVWDVRFHNLGPNCTAVATIGDTGKGLVYYPAVIFPTVMQWGASGGWDVLVGIDDLNGVFADRPYHLQIQCPKQPDYNEYARVSAAGVLSGGNGIAKVTRLGVGRYEVFATRDLRQCTYVASTDVASNYPPLLVFTASGHSSAKAVYVETKNIGGGLTDAAFEIQISSNC